jgi:hypothetical protein
MLNLKKKLGEGWFPPSSFVYLGMEIKEVIELLGDKIFTVTFTKKDGSVRIMNARRGVSKGVKGVGMSYNPAQKGLVVVFDMQKQAFRMINANTIHEIKAEKKIYIFKDGELQS